MKNWAETLESQYANSPTIVALVQAFNDWIDPSVNINTFLANIWDVTTAVGIGLDIWGQIVNVPRVLQISTPEIYFGFSEAFTEATANTGPQPFGSGTFYSGPPATTSYSLTDDAYRTLILVKAMSNISDCSVPSVNAILQFLFAGDGRCYVQDTGDMTERFVFEFPLTPVQLAIMLTSNVIPRPAGVEAFVMTYAAGQTFGFSEGGGQPFGYGVFFNQSQLQAAS
jgi:hypothetical protein